MEVRINQMSSRVTATDSEALLDPRVLERLVRLVARRVREEQEHGERAKAERRLTRSSTPEEMVP